MRERGVDRTTAAAGFSRANPLGRTRTPAEVADSRRLSGIRLFRFHDGKRGEHRRRLSPLCLRVRTRAWTSSFRQDRADYRRQQRHRPRHRAAPGCGRDAASPCAERQGEARRRACRSHVRQGAGIWCRYLQAGEVAALVNDAIEAFGQIDIVVSNAGTHRLAASRRSAARTSRGISAPRSSALGSSPVAWPRICAGAAAAGSSSSSGRPARCRRRMRSPRPSPMPLSTPSSNRYRTSWRRAIFA